MAVHSLAGQWVRHVSIGPTFLLLRLYILLKLTEHGDSTTQGREPVSDVYIARHCYSVVLGSGSSIGMVASSTR